MKFLNTFLKILKFHNREMNKYSNNRTWKFKDFVLTESLVPR